MPGTIPIKPRVMILAVLATSLAVAAVENQEATFSQEVLARLELSAEVRAKVTAVFAEYATELAEQRRATKEAQADAWEELRAARMGGGGKIKTKEERALTKKKWDEEREKWMKTIHERDARVGQVLPPELRVRFERGLQLLAERQTKLSAVTDTFTGGKYQAIYEEYRRQLDEEVGRVKGPSRKDEPFVAEVRKGTSAPPPETAGKAGAAGVETPPTKTSISYGSDRKVDEEAGRVKEPSRKEEAFVTEARQAVPSPPPEMAGKARDTRGGTPSKTTSEWKRLDDEVASLCKQGHYDRALVVAEKALQVAEGALGPNHPDVATSLNNLALLRKTQGQYAQAELLYKRSLAIREQALGPNHPDVAQSLGNLAMLYESQGHYEEAEALHKRSLAIEEKALGPNHPDVATTLNNLAVLYESQGQYAQAESLYKHSLAILEKVCGREHPDVAASLTNLASLYESQGQYTQAEPLYLRSLVIREKVLGPNHLDVATSLTNLGSLYQNQGQSALAVPLYKRALAIREKALGSNHPDVATSLEDLAALYRKTGNEKAAEQCERRAAAIRAIKR